MQRVKAKVGDTVWIYGPNHNGKLRSTKVVAAFTRHNSEHYVVEIDTHIDPLYEVFDEFTISDAEDRPIGMYRRN